MLEHHDVIIVGAGAAGLFCGIHAARTGKTVLIVDHAAKPGEKIRISGGGRCNFTNLHCGPHAFISQNPHFVKSALSQFSQHDFIALVDRHRIAWHEKTLGQLFCDGRSQQVIEMLTSELARVGANLRLSTQVTDINKTQTGFSLRLDQAPVSCTSLVIATGGKSIPKMGATGFGYDVARQFGLEIVEPRPALVPLTFDQALLQSTADLSGISVSSRISCNRTSFEEALLFTHRGLSGPAILQISSYWREGDEISVRMIPDTNIASVLQEARKTDGKKSVKNKLSDFLPSRLAEFICQKLRVSGNLGDLNNQKIQEITEFISGWQVKPAGSEGYRTAEVTLGGVSTSELSGKTMQVHKVPGLYFIGEVVDVTGWLGGYNFQWAWSSAFVAGRHLASQ